MAMALGAELIDTEYIKPSYGFIRNAADANDFSMIFYSGAVILNQNGERFVDESMSYKDIGPIALVQPNGRSYIIFDENIRLMQLQNRPPEKRLFGHITQDSKHIYFAEDLSEAARRAGLNPENTVRTIQNYNQSIKTGKEVSFKRLSLSGAFGTPVPIEKAPFYIMPATCGIMGTYCGIRVNAKTQVLIQGKHPVKNLLAAGEIMGAFTVPTLRPVVVLERLWHSEEQPGKQRQECLQYDKNVLDSAHSSLLRRESLVCSDSSNRDSGNHPSRTGERTYL